MKHKIKCHHCQIGIENAPLKLYGKKNGKIYCADCYWDICLTEIEIRHLKEHLNYLIKKKYET